MERMHAATVSLEEFRARVVGIMDGARSTLPDAIDIVLAGVELSEDAQRALLRLGAMEVLMHPAQTFTNRRWRGGRLFLVVQDRWAAVRGGRDGARSWVSKV